MARKKRDPTNTVIYSFGVDSNDPKYEGLINFLDGIDSGARSYVIRQILNSYVSGQSSNMMFPLIPDTNEQPQQNEVKEEIVDTSKVEMEDKEEKVRKPKPDPRLASLKNTFS